MGGHGKALVCFLRMRRNMLNALLLLLLLLLTQQHEIGNEWMGLKEVNCLAWFGLELPCINLPSLPFPTLYPPPLIRIHIACTSASASTPSIHCTWQAEQERSRMLLLRCFSRRRRLCWPIWVEWQGCRYRVCLSILFLSSSFFPYFYLTIYVFTSHLQTNLQVPFPSPSHPTTPPPPPTQPHSTTQHTQF